MKGSLFLSLSLLFVSLSASAAISVSEQKSGVFTIDINNGYYEEIYKTLGDTQNCLDYEGGYNSFRLSSAFGDTPFSDIENCLSLALEKSVGVICEQEKILKGLIRSPFFSFTPEALDQIEEVEGSLDLLKESVVDQLYAIADIFDEMELLDDLADEIGERLSTGTGNSLARLIDEELDTDNGVVRSISKMFVRSEVGGFTKFFEHKAKALCGYNIFASSDDDGDED